MGCYIWYSEEGTGWVPITVLLYYDGPLLCGFNVAIKGLSMVGAISPEGLKRCVF